MKVEITPEPTDEERAAILEALAQEDAGPAPAPAPCPQEPIQDP